MLPTLTWIGLDMLSSELLPIGLTETKMEFVQLGGAAAQDTRALG